MKILESAQAGDSSFSLSKVENRVKSAEGHLKGIGEKLRTEERRVFI